jgi:hypothetical protein
MRRTGVAGRRATVSEGLSGRGRTERVPVVPDARAGVVETSGVGVAGAVCSVVPFVS